MAEDSVTTSPSPTPNRRTRWILAGGLVLAAVAVAAWVHLAGRQSTDDAQIDGHIAPVAAKVSGLVAVVRVKDNQQVNAGDVLVEIDPRDLQVALAKAEADLAEARAVAEGARSGVSVNTTAAVSQLTGARAEEQNAQAGVDMASRDIESSRAKLASAEARQREAEASLDKASKDKARLEPLVAKEEVSKQQFDLVVATEQAARASLDSARASVVEAREGDRHGAEPQVAGRGPADAGLLDGDSGSDGAGAGAGD